jgi:hypothetical protein
MISLGIEELDIFYDERLKICPPRLLYLRTGAGTTEEVCCMGNKPDPVLYSRAFIVSNDPLMHWLTH